MKKKIIPVLLAAALAQSAQAQTMQLDVVSSYTMRGMQFGDGVAVQPSVSVRKGIFTSSLWANRDPHVGWNEIDVYAKIAGDVGGVHLEAAYGKFFFWHAPVSESQEVSLSASHHGAQVFAVYDFRAGKGQYGELSYTYRQSGRVAIGYNNRYFTNKSSLSHLEARLNLPLAFSGFTVTPQIGVNKALHENFKDKALASVSFAF